MPASEETYRPQPTLHLVFAISSIAMLLSTVWMVMADHLRPWKQVQREFQASSARSSRRAEQEKLEEQKTKYQAQIDEIDAKIKAAEASAETRAGELRKIDKELDKLGGKAEQLDIQRRFKKADLDSKRSLYDGMIDRGEEREARTYLTTVVAGAERELDGLSLELEAARREVKAKKAEKEKLLGFVDDLKKEKERLTREADRVKRVIEQKDAALRRSGQLVQRADGFLRSLPGIDLMPPTKIQQISLPELTINYNFKEVPRYDRCTTCHQGIDRIGYDKDADGEPMTEGLRVAPVPDHGRDDRRSQGARSCRPGSISTPTARIRSTASAARSATAARARAPTSPMRRTRPTTLEQAEEWHEEHGWHEIHFWDYPDAPQAVHRVELPEVPPPGDRHPPGQEAPGGLPADRQVRLHGLPHDRRRGLVRPRSDRRAARSGPTSRTSARRTPRSGSSSGSPIPHAFRPDSRMPRFYGLTNNDDKEDWPKNYAEIHAITHYLFAKSTEPAEFVDPPAKTDPAKGKELFLQKGCLACHQHRPYQTGRDPAAGSTRTANPDLQARSPPLTYDPKGFPASVRGLRPGRISARTCRTSPPSSSRKPAGAQVAVELDRGPGEVSSQEPDAQPPALARRTPPTSRAGSSPCPANGRSRSRCPASRPRKSRSAVDELVKLYVTKSGSFKKADGKSMAVSLSEVDDLVDRSSATRREAAVPRREDDLPAGLLRLPHDPRLRERQADRHRAQRLGDQEPRPARFRAHQRVPRRTRTADDGRQPRRHRPVLPGEGHARDPDGLPLSRSCTGPGATTT